MAFVRMLVSWGVNEDAVAERFSNTLYFNVSGAVGQDPDYQALVNDLWAIYAARSFCGGSRLEVRAYNLADDKPRPEKAFKGQVVATGGQAAAARQVAVALSYYADRNLPRRRGRIFTGPWANTNTLVSTTIRNELITHAQALAGLGGLNVDWSVYSPTTDTGGKGAEGHWRISNVWVDNSWDVIRSRKYPATQRTTATLNG